MREYLLRAPAGHSLFLRISKSKSVTPDDIFPYRWVLVTQIWIRMIMIRRCMRGYYINSRFVVEQAGLFRYGSA